MRVAANLLAKHRLEIVSFFVGGVVLAFELTAARLTAPYIGTTIYIWTSIIGVILAALAIGYWLGGYLADKRQQINDVLLLLILAALMILIVNLTKDWFLAQLSQSTLPLRGEALIASLVLFGPPTIALGAISPYLARLSLSSLATSGRRIAGITAAGTIGSLVGTFVTGYLLFGYVGSRQILNLLVICLLVTSLLLPSRQLLLLRLLFIILALFLTQSTPKLHLSGVKEDTDSHYSRIVVRDTFLGQRPVRVLHNDALGWQSGVYRDGDQGLAFGYIRAFSYLSHLNHSAKQHLVIGGGAFTLPGYLAKAYPAAQVDVVEIDGRLVPISEQFFNFKQRSNLRIFPQDGRQFLAENDQQYDFIYVDVFTSLVPPFHLLTSQAITQIRDALKADGLIAINIVAAPAGPSSELIKAVSRTFKAVFPQVAVYRVYPEASPLLRQNLILTASFRPLDRARLQASAVNAEARDIFNRPVAVDDHSGVLLTDNFAPVERLAEASL